jgi:hypothetical protein
MPETTTIRKFFKDFGTPPLTRLHFTLTLDPGYFKRFREGHMELFTVVDIFNQTTNFKRHHTQKTYREL